VALVAELRPRSPNDLTDELALIQEQLRTLVSRDDHAAIRRDLARIRTNLQRLAADNESVRKVIEPLLWDEPPPVDA
jgi:hypothetical protein